ncbi:SNF2 family DNA-dependent ATPase [Laccaria bicolor S238N-H82]|uniref:SNF2 family DNA-dependent ATPase n=1 Tax=Laccaria bicolor (strain S238N-H82 / ATCC MYA-4686) TaxID=486041 RepID=B0CR59_LACBS|nr:SNF2 family DNA-dependent ATPase [Laccaria bicolor S238N-H82]EDR15764.1 SNF2 family DNA-dependent ATPase [Laccaria bicolor S238N-H82]|eukprot:XP_001873972.1 SNF2 family DNA-dependent ATPase [Laccaria bicolor S238N-H82]
MSMPPTGSEHGSAYVDNSGPGAISKATSSRQGFFIVPPTLPPSQKEQYKPVIETSLKTEYYPIVDEVIGEYREGNNLYYFARYHGGIAHKFLGKPFKKDFSELVDEYKRKERAGLLPPFDPSATYIHPLSRVKMKISIRNNRATVNISSARSVRSSSRQEVMSDSEEDLESDESSDQDEQSDVEEEESDEESADSVNIVRTRSCRTAAKKTYLPFSPKKTRSQKFLAIEDSDSEETNGTGEDNAERHARVGARRSIRIKKPVVINLESDDYNSDTNDSDEFALGPKRRSQAQSATKTTRRPKQSQPAAYGYFRDVATLEYSDDEDNTTLGNHRNICEKCHLAPGHVLLKRLAKKSKSKGKKRKRGTDDEFEESDDEARYTALGGWVQCLKCPVAAHWQCLAITQRDEILKAAKERDSQAAIASEIKDLPKRVELITQQTTKFICVACTRGGICMGCKEVALQPAAPRVPKPVKTGQEESRDIPMLDESGKTFETGPGDGHQISNELLFRCFTCKRLAHYRHLPIPIALSHEASISEIAVHYQSAKSWLCADCSSYRYGLDKIIAWRPYPPNAVEVFRPIDQPPHYKEQLPREYLVKWLARSYRRTEWVPHMWLVATNPSKLRNFLISGPKVELLQEVPKPDAAMPEASPVFEIAPDSRASSPKPGSHTTKHILDSLSDAEGRIPPAWKIIDRVLDVVLWFPNDSQKQKKQSRQNHPRKKLILSDSELESSGEKLEAERSLIFDRGEEPPANLTAKIVEWESQHNRPLNKDDISHVVWAFVKWDDLTYDEATWDTPPRAHETGYDSFVVAFNRFVDSRSVVVPKLNRTHTKDFDAREKGGYKKHILKDASDLDLGQDPRLKLMPFQVDGFNWLCNNWWNLQHCILADDMGLGKTVQIATFLGSIIGRWNALPALVVVPNSTITNWVRELERWAPKLRVVPFHGDKKARDVIKEFELYHKVFSKHNTNAKFHVLVTTYDALINAKDFTSVFKHQPRWEILVVDEGQRLKSDSSLLFKKLNELNTIHRIILTGTPLNNNMRELFNLMNFLDPVEWHDLESLEKQHEVLDEDLVKQLHNRLRPYFLRRIKSEVLQLPPKNEVIIPVSMAPLQKEVYRSILSHNLELLKGLTQPKFGGPTTKGRLNNILMHLRKCLQHPYLYAEDIEPRGLPPQETHEKLIDGSAKLRFLKALLPKLKARGHRVLLFSQFVIALNVIEDFLQGEGYKFLRLDGDTKGSERQKGMDEFNRPGSDYFVYLLTTRAGGVGINLYTADTVIIFDPDFNPHQAIARAYRYGQKKTCLVFKLMVKDSAEERIMQIGKKKLVLDHLIVQKMDDDEEGGGGNVQSILSFGAQALFELEQDSRDIIYTDNDIDKLIEKTEKENEEQATPKDGGLSFSFAKIWAADKDSLEEVDDDDQVDSWARTLQRITAEREKEESKETALSGRGARRRAADVAKTKMLIEEIPGKSKSTPNVSPDGSAYFGSDADSDVESSDDAKTDAVDEDFKMDSSKRKTKLSTLSPPLNGYSRNTGDDDVVHCGLCGGRHGQEQCLMTDKSENLAEYREMLILHADDEPWEERNVAVRAIDEILNTRGHLSLIAGQPLHPLPKSSILPPPVKKPKYPPQITQISQPSTSHTPFSRSTDPTKHTTSDKHPEPQHNPLPGPSSAASSSLSRSTGAKAVDGSKKKFKTPSVLCPVCHQTPLHLLKDCPLVLEGSKSLSKQIKRLEDDHNPAAAGTLQILRKILAKQIKKEAAESVS